MKTLLFLAIVLSLTSTVSKAEISPDEPGCKDGKVGLACDLEKAAEDYKELVPANLKKAKVVKTYSQDVTTVTEYDNGRMSYICKDRQGIDRPVLNNFPFTKEEAQTGANLISSVTAQTKSIRGDDFCDTFEDALARAPSYYELILFGQKHKK
jgi:hypothetical protein